MVLQHHLLNGFLSDFVFKPNGFTNNVLLQPVRWCCVDCVIHHERDVREEQKYVCVEQASNNKRNCDCLLFIIIPPGCARDAEENRMRKKSLVDKTW